MQKFRKYAKNSWILRGSNLGKESIHGRYMMLRHILSINPSNPETARKIGDRNFYVGPS